MELFPADGHDKPQETHDEVLQQVTEILEMARMKNSQFLEIELRLGRFATNNHFTPGYSCRDLANKLMCALAKNCQHKLGWTEIKKHQFMTATFPKNIRKRTHILKPPEIVRKNKITTLDIGSDREYGLRLAVSEEIPIRDNFYDTEEPMNLRITERASFIQTLKLSPLLEVTFQYDISKTSTKGATKMDLTKNPSEYHCEIELIGNLVPLANKTEQRKQSQLIAAALLSCGRELFGNFRLTDNGLERLPTPALHFIKIS